MHTRFPAGALVCCGLGTKLDGHDWQRLAAAGLAGHVIFRRNVPDATSLAALAAELRSLATPALLPILAIDEEGGVVSRLNHLGFDPPAALALAAGGVPARAREVAEAIGAVLAALGLNTVFAPCLDVLTEPLNPVIATRAYGDHPAQVTGFGLAALEGFRTAGIAPVIKHFPGHGGTSADSHTTEPVVYRAFSEMEACELAPFAAGVKAGAPGVMSAHVRYPDATPEAERALPATHSRYWLEEVLRRRLGFAGPIFSDALEMTGAGAGASFEERIERAIAAGVDLLVCDELEHGLAARAHLERLAAEVRWQGRLADALARVTDFRRRLAPRTPAASASELAQALAAPQARFASAQRAAIAKVGDPKPHLPIPPSIPLFVALPRGLDSERQVDLAWFETMLGERFASVHLVAFDPGLEAPLQLAAEWAHFTSGSSARASRSTALLATLGRGDTRWIREATRVFGDGPGARVGVALDRPAEVLEMPGVWARLITYGFGRNALTVLSEVLAGTRTAEGHVLGLGALQHH